MQNQVTGTTNKWVALIVAAMASFLITFIASSINIALPAIGREFTLTAISINWIVTSYLLAAAVFLVPFGRLADIVGRKRIFLYGILIETIGLISAAFAPSGVFLILFRVIQGIGSAMIFGTSIAIVTSVFPVAERGRALGITVASVYVGLSIGPPVGGILTEQLGWRAIFGLDAVLGVVIVAIALWNLKGEWAGAKGEYFDIKGALIYGSVLFALIYGFSLLPALWGFGLVAAGIGGLVFFVRRECRVSSPILNTCLFRGNATFTLSNLTALISYIATFSVAFLLSLYLQYIKGFNAGNVGLILIARPVIMAVLSPVAGRLSDKFEPRVLSTAGLALTIAGLILLVFLNQNTGLRYILSALIIMGLGFGLFSSPNTNAIMSSVEKKFYGVASGMVATMRLTGQMLSLGIVLLLFSLFIGEVEITPEYHLLFLKSTRASFITFAILCFGGIFASFLRGKLR